MNTSFVSSLALVVLLASSSSAAAAAWGPLEILDASVAPGTKAQLSFLEKESFLKGVVDVDVHVTRGARPGPTLCLMGAVHGDELNGVEIARRIHADTDPASFSGTIISIPIVNVWGFRSGSRYLPDRRDLNRAFPGSRNGSTASRIAFGLFERVIRKCDFLIDLHTGSDERTNVPQIRVDLANEAARNLALHFAEGVVLSGAGPEGSLRRAATDAGVPAIIYEAGGPYRFEKAEIDRGVEGVTNVLEYLKMLPTAPPKADPLRIYQSTTWVRSGGGGIFLTDRSPGENVFEGDLLGTVTDPGSSERVDIVAPFSGTLIGMAYPQVVLPGYGLFHLAKHEKGTVEPAEDELPEN